MGDRILAEIYLLSKYGDEAVKVLTRRADQQPRLMTFTASIV